MAVYLVKWRPRWWPEPRYVVIVPLNTEWVVSLSPVGRDELGTLQVWARAFACRCRRTENCLHVGQRDIDPRSRTSADGSRRSCSSSNAAAECFFEALQIGRAYLHSVADLAVGLILVCLRQIVAAAEHVRAGNWTPQWVGTELRATTVGVVGTGLIGREVIKRLHGFEPRVLAYDVVESPEMVQRFGVEYVSFDQLLRQSDVITLHAPLLPETRGLIDAAALAKMKPTAYVVNTARGPLVDEIAIARGLHAGQIAGAALDVFEREPLPASSPLRQAPNVILTPHVAGVTHESRAAMASMAVENVVRVLRGESPVSCVNPEVLQTAEFRWRGAGTAR